MEFEPDPELHAALGYHMSAIGGSRRSLPAGRWRH